MGTPPAGQAGRLIGGRQPLPHRPALPRPRPVRLHAHPVPALAAAPGQLCGPRTGVQGERVWLWLQTRGPGEAEACRELSQLQALRATGTRPVTQVPGVHGIFSRAYTARASWRKLTRDTGSRGHALSLDCVTHAEAPGSRPWNWGSTLTAVPAESLGAAGVGRRPSLASRSPSAV